MAWEGTAALENNTRIACSQRFVLKSRDGYVWWGEPGMLKAWWDSLRSCAWAAAAAGPDCDPQRGRFMLAFSPHGMAHASSLLLLLCGNPPFHLCFPVEREQPVLGSAHPGALLQRLPACRLLTVPDIPHLLGSPKFSSSFGHRLQLCAYML